MYVCNYCNRVLKNDYKVCPGCGGNSFKTKAYLGEIIIKEPPKDGYKLNMKNYEKSLKIAKKTITIGIILVIVSLLFALPFLLLEIIGILPFIITIGIIIFCVGNSNRKRVENLISRSKKLATKGILIKATPYKIINTGVMVMGKYYKCIQVNFKNSAGVEIPLYSETKFDVETLNNETVDLLIDPDDYSNYFIDYEIF